MIKFSDQLRSLVYNISYQDFNHKLVFKIDIKLGPNDISEVT